MNGTEMTEIIHGSGTENKLLMHTDKIISSIALVLSAISWDQISLITGSVLAVIMATYYIICIVKKIKGNGDKKNE